MRDWLLRVLEAEIPLLLVVILRLAVGGVFLYQGYDKVQQGYIEQLRQSETRRPNPLAITIDIWLEERGTLPVYKDFLEKAIRPNAAIFSALVAVSELAVGGLLLLGLLVRFASIIGVLMCLNYFLATWHLGFPYPQINVIFVVSLVVIGLAAAGRCLGLDGVFHDRYPEIPLF